jgi:hypothetical protein
VRYGGIILFGSGLGIFFAFLTAILYLGESSPYSIAALIVGLVLIGLGIYVAGLEYKSLKTSSSSQTTQRAAQ